MVARSKHSAESVRRKPPLPKQAKIAMCAAAVVVVGAAVLIGVHVASRVRLPSPWPALTMPAHWN